MGGLVPVPKGGTARPQVHHLHLSARDITIGTAVTRGHLETGAGPHVAATS